MLNRNRKIIIILVGIIILLFGIGFAKLKINSFSKMILPALEVSVGNVMYYIDKNSYLYKTSYNGNSQEKLLDYKIDRVGIIVFEGKLYFISKDNKKVCSMELNSHHLREIDKCNIIMPNQPIFKLGEHVYYYDNRNILTRIDCEGKHEKVDARAEKCCRFNSIII
jgi:hypothetical protein